MARTSVEEVAHLEAAVEPEASAAQITLPLASVVNLPPLVWPEQSDEASVENVRPPPESTRPLIVEEAEVALIAVVWIPPAKVEVAVEVEVMTPVVKFPTELEEKKELTKRPMVAKKEVLVALVAEALANVCPPDHVLVSESKVEEANDQVDVPNEYKRPAELTATPPAESDVMEIEEVAVKVPTVKFPIEEEAV
jgi:hypothetical protein